MNGSFDAPHRSIANLNQRQLWVGSGSPAYHCEGLESPHCGSLQENLRYKLFPARMAEIGTPLHPMDSIPMSTLCLTAD